MAAGFQESGSLPMPKTGTTSLRCVLLAKAQVKVEGRQDLPLDIREAYVYGDRRNVGGQLLKIISPP